jgi:hypothetical protein
MTIKFRPHVQHAGDKKTLRFTIMDYDTDPTGATPLNLAAFTGKWSLARKAGNTYKAVPEAFGDLIVTDTAGGVLEIAIDETVTAELEGSYQQQVRLYHITDSNAPSVVGKGDFFIERTQLDA